MAINYQYEDDDPFGNPPTEEAYPVMPAPDEGAYDDTLPTLADPEREADNIDDSDEAARRERRQAVPQDPTYGDQITNVEQAETLYQEVEDEFGRVESASGLSNTEAQDTVKPDTPGTFSDDSSGYFIIQHAVSGLQDKAAEGDALQHTVQESVERTVKEVDTAQTNLDNNEYALTGIQDNIETTSDARDVANAALTNAINNVPDGDDPNDDAAVQAAAQVLNAHQERLDALNAAYQDGVRRSDELQALLDQKTKAAQQSQAALAKIKETQELIVQQLVESKVRLSTEAALGLSRKATTGLLDTGPKRDLRKEKEKEQEAFAENETGQTIAGSIDAEPTDLLETTATDTVQPQRSQLELMPEIPEPDFRPEGREAPSSANMAGSEVDPPTVGSLVFNRQDDSSPERGSGATTGPLLTYRGSSGFNFGDVRSGGFGDRRIYNRRTGSRIGSLMLRY